MAEKRAKRTHTPASSGVGRSLGGCFFFVLVQLVRNGAERCRWLAVGVVAYLTSRGACASEDRQTKSANTHTHCERTRERNARNETMMTTLERPPARAQPSSRMQDGENTYIKMFSILHVLYLNKCLIVFYRRAHAHAHAHTTRDAEATAAGVPTSSRRHTFRDARHGSLICHNAHTHAHGSTIPM